MIGSEGRTSISCPQVCTEFTPAERTLSTRGCSQAHMVTCVLGTSMSQLQRHLCACKRVRFQVIHVIAMLALPHVSLSQPYHNTKHHLDSTIFSKNTPHIQHNFFTTTFSENRKLILLNSRLSQGRKESLQILSVTTKSRVAELHWL